VKNLKSHIKDGYLISNIKSVHGFTVVELLVSMGILAILFALTTISLGRLPGSASQGATVDMLLTDIRSQQTQAMSNDSGYGVHFESGSYTLFKGSSYSSNNSSNFVVTLDPGLTFINITFPGSQIIYSPGNGEILSGSGSFTLSSSQIGQDKSVNINKYGATY